MTNEQQNIAPTDSQNQLTPQEIGRIRRFVSSLLIVGDVASEAMITYQALVAILNKLFGSTHYDVKVMKRVFSAILASVNAVGDFSAGNASLHNAVQSLAQAIKARTFDREFAISSASYLLALAAASPEFVFSLNAGKEMGETENATFSDITEYGSYFMAPAMSLSHAIFYYPKIKELLSQNPATTLKDIYSSISSKTLANNFLRLVALGFAIDRIAEFTNTEVKDVLNMVSDKESGNGFIVPAIIAATGLAPITVCAMDNVANSLYNKLSGYFQHHNHHIELVEDPENQNQAGHGHAHNHNHRHVNQNHQEHGHSHNGLLFFLAAAAGSLPPILQAFEESGVTTIGVIRAMILISVAFAIFNQIHDHGHEATHMAELETRPSTQPTPALAQAAISERTQTQ